MRRLHIVCLFLVLLAPHLADAAEPALKMAPFEADVTPPLGAVLCHGSVAPAKEIVTPLTARGVVLVPAGQPPIVLCAVDWVGIGNEAHDAWRRALAEAAGTVPGRVAVHVVHQHDAPGVDESTEKILAEHGLGGSMFDVEFARQTITKVAGAVRRAAGEACRVTHLGIGRGQVEKVASNRRILSPEGKCVLTRMSSCRNADAIAAPEGLIDPWVRLVSFWNDERLLSVITYYATHPQSYYGRGGVNWDFAGMARAQRQDALGGVTHVHFNGAGGDIAAGKYNDGSPSMRPLLAQRLEHGMEAAWEAIEKVPVRANDVRWRVCPVSLPVRERIRAADCLAKLNATDLPAKQRRFAARDLAWLRRMESGHRIDLSCLQLGPVSIVHMPGELCIEYQLAAQEMRPDRFVCMAAYGDLGPGYICREIAYQQGGYETGIVSRVAPTVEQVLLDGLRELLAAPTPADEPPLD